MRCARRLNSKEQEHDRPGNSPSSLQVLHHHPSIIPSPLPPPPLTTETQMSCNIASRCNAYLQGSSKNVCNNLWQTCNRETIIFYVYIGDSVDYATICNRFTSLQRDGSGFSQCRRVRVALVDEGSLQHGGALTAT